MATAAAMKNLGNEAFKAGNYEAAIDGYSKCLELDPENYTVWSNRSAAYASLSPPLYDKALFDADQTIKLNPEWPKGHFRKGVAHKGLQQWEQAISSLSTALAKTPGADPTIQALLASARECQKKHYGSRAVDSVTDPEECKRLGNALFKDSNYVEAAAYYSRGIDLIGSRSDPSVAVFYVNRAACHAQTHSYKLVIEDCTVAISLDPVCVKAYLRRAIAYEGLEKWAEAAADYKKVVEIAPGSTNASQGYDRCSKFLR